MAICSVEIDETKVNIKVFKDYIESNFNNIIFQMNLENEVDEVRKSPISDFVNL